MLVPQCSDVSECYVEMSHRDSGCYSNKLRWDVYHALHTDHGPARAGKLLFNLTW